MVKIYSQQLLPTVVRIRDLKPGQVGLQVEKDIVWTKVDNRLLFTSRADDSPWHLAPSNNAKVFVMPYEPRTEVSFVSAA
jgi:hypothetical protein